MTALGYDSSGRLNAITDPALVTRGQGLIFSYSYDPSVDHITSLLNPRSDPTHPILIPTTFSYNFAG